MNHALQNVRFVGVRFRTRSGEYGRKEHIYRTTDAKLKIGDAVVVESDENFLFSIGFVTSTNRYVNEWEAGNCKWVVQKISREIHADERRPDNQYDDRHDTGHWGGVSSHDAWDYEDI